MKIIFYSYFFLLFTSYAAFSQKEFFENINTKNGLNSDAIFDLKKDSKGFLWVHSNLGITRYDGYRFDRFGSNIRPDAMDLDAENNIWLSNNSGLFKINSTIGTTQNFLKSNLRDSNPDNDHFDGLYVDKKGWVWSTDFHHLKAYIPEKKKLKIFKVLDKNQLNPRIGYFENDKSGNLWSVSPLGFCKFDYLRNRWIRFSSKQDFSCIYYDEKSGEFLLGDNKGQLFKYLPAQNVLVKIQEFRETIISISRRGSQYLVLTPSQLVAYHKQDHKVYFFEDLVSQSLHFHSLFINENQEIWLSTDEGIFKQSFEKQVIESVLLPKYLVSDKAIVSAIAKISHQQYALGLSTGELLIWNKISGIFSKIDFKISGKINEIFIFEDQIFLATDQGLFKISLIGRIQKILKGEFASMTFDNKNRLWLLSPNEPFRVLNLATNKEEFPWHKLPYNSFFKENLFKKIYYYRDKIWIAGWIPKGFGMAVFDLKDKTFQELSNSNSHADFVSDYYLNVGLSKTGNLLFSAYGGFNEVNPKGKIISKFSSEKYQESVADYQYFNINGSPSGVTWIGTKEGLARISSNGSINRFTRFDGLLSNDVSNGFLVDEHQLLIGHKNGVSVVDFDLLNESNLHNNLVLSKVYVLGKPALEFSQANLRFKKSDNSISFSFSPLNFVSPQKLKYRYKLSGISESWIENGSNPNFVFPNLNKGKYTLEVQHAKISGAWSSKSTLLNFEVLPAWYETTWFRLILTASILCLFYVFYRFRLNEIKRVYDIRNRISADLHDEIGASLSSIGIMGGLLKLNLSADIKNKSFAEMIADEAKKAGNAIDYIIWNINPKFDSLESLFTKINKEASELIEAQNMQYVFESKDLINKNLSLENKRNVYLILKELINNALKYSKAQKISLHCKATTQHLYISFADNGSGFDSKQATNRNGIVNIKSRINAMNGTCKIESQIGNGTSFEIKIPLK